MFTFRLATRKIIPMRLNPEIQRNLWLEFSWHRAIAMPVVLALILLAVSHASSDGEDVKNVFLASFGLFYLIVSLWGGYKAASSVVDEVNDNTWDFQRLSALTPWSLTVGKLFGAPSYAWYGGIILFIIICITLPYSGSGLWQREGMIAPIHIITAALTVHAVALLSSLISIQGNTKAHRKYRAFGYLIVGLFIVGRFIGGNASDILMTPRMAGLMPKTIDWYGWSCDAGIFQLITALSLLGWCIAGIYWQMRYQMGEKNTPILWISFVAFWLIHIGGGGSPIARLDPLQDLPAVLRSMTPFAFSIACFYIMAFWESWGLVSYRKLSTLIAEKNYKEVWATCPRWLVALPLCLLAAAWPIVLLKTAVDLSALLTFVGIVLCFSIRDVAILHFFKLSLDTRRAKQATLFYLVVLYGLLPFLCSVLHWDAGKKFPASSARTFMIV